MTSRGERQQRGMEHDAAVGHPDRSTEQTGHVADDAVHAEYLLQHVYDAGGPRLCLKVRYYDDEEVHDWQDGPSLVDTLEQAAVDGWQPFNREPGNAPGEYAIYHLVRATGSSASR